MVHMQESMGYSPYSVNGKYILENKSVIHSNIYVISIFPKHAFSLSFSVRSTPTDAIAEIPKASSE